MTESFLTTDIIVIVVLIVVLACIGACAFLTHFYWTKIGVAEIWNTTKWSSIRSSFYRTIGRLSRASSKYSSGRPLSGYSNYNDESIPGLPPPSNEIPSAAVGPQRVTKMPEKQSQSVPPQQRSLAQVTEKKPNSSPNSKQQSTSEVTNTRRNSRGVNQVQPVSTIPHNNSSSGSTVTHKQKPPSQYATKIGQPPANTKIHNIHESNNVLNGDDEPEIFTARF
ncbi:unnamed protein product [Didymodactylos carnosus]|uniref:Uncharacterized protein n=1 Tax=Didymodactylos carnosus TaxID=1234261 RepID=A0A814CHX6_9BILA|nr:unnamed protein product [Didymodactylos carnosus]CAF0940339.1 unnamed protein product [Didymodactylos carnosus]CAF3673055.1 unnamed protein product [Didymodactylos carnosus]CAF3716913.1 unnamed protein product [Didymodactylos carnosus]